MRTSVSSAIADLVGCVSVSVTHPTFTGDLQAIQDSATHVSIMPKVTMSLEKYEAALANTQKYWEKID